MNSSIANLLLVLLNTPIGDPNAPLDHHSVILGVPVCFVGLSGVSKTKQTRAIVQAMGLDAHYVYAGVKQPEDFAGVFVPTPDGVVVECVLPAARRCINKGEGVIVLDEVNGASARVQYALLSFVDERQVGDVILPNKTRFILMMNPTEHATGGNVLTPAFANRMAHIAFPTPTNDEFSRYVQGATTQAIAAKDAMEVVKKQWAHFWPEYVGLMAGFLHTQPSVKVDDEKVNAIHHQPEPDDPAASGPWPSFRTWYMGLRAMCTAACLQDYLDIPVTNSPAEATSLRRSALRTLQHDILASLVGTGPAVVWMTWTANMDLPSAQQMLNNGFTPDTRRLDRTIAALTTLTQHVCGLPPDQAALCLKKTWEIMRGVFDAGLGDIAHASVRTLFSRGLADGGSDRALQKIINDMMTDITQAMR